MRKCKYSKEELEDLYFVKRERSQDIAIKLGISYGYLRTLLARFKMKRIPLDKPRPKSRYSINERYFEKIDTEEKAYWLGFIAADGCVQEGKSKYRLSIELSIKDRGHLEKLAKAIDFSGPIYYNKKHKQIYKNEAKIFLCDFLGITSKRMVLDLVKHGITQRKSKTIKPPNIQKKLYKHWIRGYFDGDGSVSLCKDGNIRGQIFSGSKDVISFIRDSCLPDASIQIYSSGFAVGFGGNQVAKKLHHYLYSGAKTFLLRKKIKFLKK